MYIGYDFFRFLGERLGSPVQAKLFYFFLAYQVIVSALVLLFASGFPPLLVFAGWILFMLLLISRILYRRRFALRDEKKDQEQERLRLRMISRLKQRLETNPGLRTNCGDCGNSRAGDDPCRAHAGPAEKEFRFRKDDASSYCLLWSPGGEAAPGRDV